MIEVKTNSLKEFNRKLGGIAREFQKAYKIPGQVNKILFDGGNNMRNHIIKEMRNTKRAPWSYKRGGKKHFPSMPQSFPAIDTGEGIRSIMFDTRIKAESAELEIGSTAGAPYMKIHEDRKDILKRRPWLKPTTDLFKPQIIEELEKVVPENLIVFMVEGLR
jgi:hypothetical protein